MAIKSIKDSPNYGKSSHIKYDFSNLFGDINEFNDNVKKRIKPYEEASFMSANGIKPDKSRVLHLDEDDVVMIIKRENVKGKKLVKVRRKNNGKV